MQTQLPITFKFSRGYIAEPYWPAREKVINIQKISGMNRARAEDKRNKTLVDYLTSKDMTMDDYKQLVAKADVPFYRYEDVINNFGDNAPNDHELDEIVVPSHQIYGCLVNAAYSASKAMRMCDPGQLRVILKVPEVFTGKTKADDKWERFVVVKAGAGMKLSNQRSLRTSYWIKPDPMQMVVEFDDNVVSVKKVHDFIRYAGSETGIGASRKMGWGRFTVIDG